MIENILANIQSIGVFTIVLSMLVVVHEWGHFITAKRLGVNVKRFAIGFGPVLFARKRNGTEFAICAIPLGGYVKMAGDEPGECTGAADEFYSQAPGRRALIAVNGPIVNFLFAYVCLAIVFMIGYPELSAKVGELIDGYPAQTAGLRMGDIITQVDGRPVDSWSTVQKQVAGSTQPTIDVAFVREGTVQHLVIVPRIERLPNIFGQERQVRLIGIRPADDIIFLRYGPLTSIGKGFEKLVEITVMTYKSIFFMITGALPAKESVTGPIGIFYILSEAAKQGFSQVLFIMGVISASLAIFNLLPVIPLDGGHLVMFGIERLRGKALPAWFGEIVGNVGFGLIICLALFVFYSDFSRFGIFEKIWNLVPH